MQKASATLTRRYSPGPARSTAALLATAMLTLEAMTPASDAFAAVWTRCTVHGARPVITTLAASRRTVDKRTRSLPNETVGRARALITKTGAAPLPLGVFEFAVDVAFWSWTTPGAPLVRRIHAGRAGVSTVLRPTPPTQNY